MAAKRVKTTTVKEELEPEQQPNVDLSGDAGNLGMLLSQFEEGTLSVEIYRDENGHLCYCETRRGTHQIEKDDIRDVWGGGKYELRVFDAGELVHTVIFRIANKPAPATNPTTTADTLMREQNSFFQKMILTMLGNNHNGGIGVKEIVEIMKINNPQSPDKTIDLALRLMEIANGKGAGDWKGELVHAVKDVAKTVAPGLLAMAQANPNGNGNGMHTNTSQIPIDPNVAIIAGLRYMKDKVIAGLPVSMALDWILANANEYKPLLNALVPAPYERFIELDPELANEPYKTWFTALHEGLKNAYAENSNDADSNGDTGDD